MNRQKFIKLFSKKLSGEIEAYDSVLLNKAISDNAHYRELADHLEQYFIKHNKSDQTDRQQQLNQIWAAIQDNENSQISGKYDYSSPWNFSIPGIWLKAAAVIIILSFVSLIVYQLLYKQSMAEIERLTTNETKTFKMLDDGTKVWLNKNSTLSYNKLFGKQKREITIEGEAYFDVVKNSKIQLFVHAGAIDIEVKGTAFNVKTQKESQNIEVALIRGLIQVSERQDENKTFLLHPNEKIVYTTTQKAENNKLQIKSIDPSELLNETKWIADTLVFRKDKLKDLAIKLEKKYDVKIDIQSEALKEKRFSGIFINETIEQALTSLKFSYPLTYTINKRLVVIKEHE